MTCFIGAPEYCIPKDMEAAELWRRLFERKGVSSGVAEIGEERNGYRRGTHPGERIFFYGSSNNWWSRNGGPETTPIGDPCGPDSEMFYDFGIPHDPAFGEHCHPNCDCGRFMEIGNNVFMSYRKEAEGVFVSLAHPNIDHGAGLERIAAAAGGDPDVFNVNLLRPIVDKVEELSGVRYSEKSSAMRVIADHLRGAVWLAVDGVVPSNTQQGYVLRRLVRRAIRRALTLDLRTDFLGEIVPVVIELYRHAYPEMTERETEVIDVLSQEERQFRRTLERGVREFRRRVAHPAPSSGGGSGQQVLTGEDIFVLSDTYGFPPELSLEEARDQDIGVDAYWRTRFEMLLREQRERSRTASAGQFKGGLADHSDISVKYHTATHLLNRALRIVLGDHVMQRGSNITPERLRFDFSHPHKLTPEEISRVQEIVNENIARDWPVRFCEMATEDAFSSGAIGAFGDRYGERVKVYTIGDPDGEWFSKEICGGPHVEHTAQLGEGGMRFRIVKEESSSSGVRRIKAVIE